jgi:hypothetical protein
MYPSEDFPAQIGPMPPIAAAHSISFPLSIPKILCDCSHQIIALQLVKLYSRGCHVIITRIIEAFPAVNSTCSQVFEPFSALLSS